jgi:hypothetical protein
MHDKIAPRATPFHCSRRRFTAGLAALALARGARATTAACRDQTPPPWAPGLQKELEHMARELTARLQPWQGPKLEIWPEQFGHRPGAPLSTAEIQAAIDAVAHQGGGTVLLTKGDYVSGTLELRSHTRLAVSKGARLLASLNLADYPARIAARPTVMDSNTGVTQSLIFAQGCQNIGICGDGVIDGRGTKQNFPGAESNGKMPDRPFVIRVLDCKGVHVQGLHLQDSACWMQNYLNCEDLLIEAITVDNQANVNNDGLDIDGCRRVIVRGCVINSEDDALCFKGASQRPTEQVLVEDCRLYSTCNALKIGTDSEGDFRKILARNLELGGPSAQMRAINRRRAESAISWEVVDGGVMEDILATRVHIVRADSPLFMRLGDRGRARPEQPRPAPGSLRRIIFDHITGDDNGSRGSYFMGLPGSPIEDVVIQELRLRVSATHAAVPDEKAIPELAGDYPDAHMIGPVSPAYGLWSRHVDRLTLSQVTFYADSHDARPMIKTEQSSKCEPSRP